MADVGILYELETTLGDLCFNDFDEDWEGNGYYHLTTVDGLDSPNIRTSSQVIPQRAGVLQFTSFIDARYPILTGRIIAPTVQRRSELMSLLRAHGMAMLNDDALLKWTPPDGVPRQVTVRLNQPVSITGGGVVKEFSLGMIAPNPFVGSQILNQQYTAFATGGDGGKATILNSGDAETYPVIRVYGPGTTHTVRNNTTGKTLVFSGLTIASGSYLEVDTWNETALLNGDEAQSKLGTLDPATADFWTLVPGVQEVQHLVATGASGSITRSLVLWRDGYA